MQYDYMSEAYTQKKKKRKEVVTHFVAKQKISAH